MFESTWLAQCPCSGGSGGGIHPLVLLATIAALWWFVQYLSKKGLLTMNKTGKIAIVLALVVFVGVVIAIKQSGSAPPAGQTNQGATGGTEISQSAVDLPRLVDLGAGKCIPCKMMAPILEELKRDYSGRLQVDVIDVWENPGAGQKYGIRVSPTQIFYDASGKELFRHEGFMSKQDILDKCKELGIDFGSRMDVQPLLPE